MSINQLEELIIRFTKKGYITKFERKIILESGKTLNIPKEIIHSFINLRIDVSKKDKRYVLSIVA